MTMAEPLRHTSFVSVPCRCGRLLRAKYEMVGSEIQCWDCRRMVVVPYPRQPGRASHAMAEGWEVFSRVETQAKILVATALVILAMMIPRIGLLAGGVALAVVAVGLLGRTLDLTSRGEAPIEPAGRSRRAFAAAVQVAIAVLMAAGTVVPLWSRHAGLQRSPRLDTVGIALLAATWIVFPIALLLAFGRDRRGRPGDRDGWRSIAYHPLMILVSLAVVPMALAFSELLLMVGTLWQGAFSFLALDLFPMPGNPTIIDGIPMYNNVNFRSYATYRYFQGYRAALGHGYSFVGALPASLSLPTTHDLNSYALALQPRMYWVVRAFLSALIVWPLVAAATLQACWLGALAAVDHRRIA